MKILRRLLTVLAALVLFGVVCAAGLIGFVYYKETHLPPVGDFDAIIVLGAQVKADGTPSVALERRLTAALEEYQKQPMLMIVCGAQGSDEPRAEGDVMRDWLIEHGVAASDIEAETGSFNTRQNLGYAQSIMDDRGLTEALIVTSDYHVPRALALCKQVGIIACGKGSPSKPEYFIKNHLREELPEGREITVTDTVGFIQKLPTTLIEAFKSTLDEITGADLVLHVVDASSDEYEAQIAAVEDVLGQIHAQDLSRVLVFNKCDLLGEERLGALKARHPQAQFVSAATGEGVGELVEHVARVASAQDEHLDVLIPYNRGDLVSVAHERCHILSETHEEQGTRIVMLAAPSFASMFRPYTVG